ncbi:serine/threonine-protein kinase [Deinococcus sp.]|uniref:serine/threonine-protein kinase n=1 Tax=Deinococcus sp. TaxID=47478 RepID=UPI0025BC74D4|nr:serine/threonine-protein kinase [Deinococcus sp.]
MTQPEQILPGYQLLHILGRGNTSVVRLALNPERRQFAVKLPHPETLSVHDAAERFGNEVRLSLQFRHPNIVQAFDGTAFGAQAFLALKYYPNGALSEHLARSSAGQIALPLEDALWILADTSAALTYLHKLGAVHQDVKTQNIYVDELGRAALGDLGNTYFVSQGGKVSGSPYYMAPEIYHGESSSAASDVYSLGVMMYELLTGQRPFNGTTYEELMIAHLTRFATPMNRLNPEVPRPLARLAEQALAKRAAERPSADAIRRAVLTALDEPLDDLSAEPPPEAVALHQVGRHGPAASLQPLNTPKPAAPAPEPKKGWNPFKRNK